MEFKIYLKYKVMDDFKVDGKLEIIHKNGQPYGIRDDGGYLMFFPNVSKYDGQEERYVDEISESFSLANKIYNALNNKTKNQTK